MRVRVRVVVQTDKPFQTHSDARHPRHPQIHARYVLTSAGLNAVLEKFYNAEYGRCPRVFCKDQPVLPAAISDIPHEEAVKVCVGVFV